jgi:predicted ferric reductase
VKIFERFMSYDRRVAIHRTLGFLGILTLSLHPILILGSYASQGIPLIVTFSLGLGFAAFLILLVIAGSTFLGRLWGVHYETWKNFHWLTFGVITLAFFHSFYFGSDMYGFFRILWAIIWAIHVAIIIGKIVHKASKRSKTYRIKEVREEGPRMTTLIMEKPDVSYRAGQFGFLSVHLDNKWQPWHPFSLTSTGGEEYLSMTIKALGDFTNRISEIKAQQAVKLDVAYGGFTASVAKDRRYVMIAGGVGVTPIYSICRELHNHPDPPEVILLYSVHHEGEILFRDDFDSWFSNTPGWQLHYVVTSQPDWKGEKGRLTPERVKEILKGDFSGTFFLCGPLSLIRSIRLYMIQMGVPRKNIRQEQFVFLP